MSNERSYSEEFKERLQRRKQGNQFRNVRQRFQVFRNEEHEPLVDGEKGGYHIMLWPDIEDSRTDERVHYLRQYLELNDVKVVAEKSTATITQLDVRTQNKPVMDSLRHEFRDTVATVSPVPTTQYSSSCSIDMTHKQAARKQLLGDVKVTGGEGVKCVVIDEAPPYDAGEINNSYFFEGREGGNVEIIYEGNRQRGIHGLVISDVLGGMYTGIASGVDLDMIQHSYVVDDYGLLYDLVASDRGNSLFLVNMSYHLIFLVGSNQDEHHYDDALNSWNMLYQDLVTEYGNVVFLVAAGNDALDICQPYVKNGNQMVAWPAKYDYLNNTGWFEFVAATDPFTKSAYEPANFPSPLRAPYSNFGGCIKYTAPGGFCSVETLDSTRTHFGTSFSTPAALGIMALYAAENEIKSASDMIQVFDENATLKLDEPNDATYMVKLGEDLQVDLEKSDEEPPQEGLLEWFDNLDKEQKILLILALVFGLFFLVVLYHMVKYAILGAREPQYEDDHDDNNTQIYRQQHPVNHSPQVV